MTSKQWQLAGDAATRYEAILVPAILGPFAKALVDWADLKPGSTVVDVGCGTGAATRYAAAKIGHSGKVIGTDVNPGMLKVAQSLPKIDGAPIDWQQETAYDLPMNVETADAVLCAQTLQFLDDRPKALSEMHRILKTNGILYLSLWCPIEQNPYFYNLVNTIADHLGADTAAGLGAAFKLSDPDEIQSILHAAGFSELETTVAEIKLDLPPVQKFVPRHIHATPMGPGYDAASPAAQQAILDELVKLLFECQTDAGICVPFRSYLVQAVK
ncbi:MAG: methyltransferase domain-containing protein [Anaerolineae bacterium]|nr:methyltransferase domain-containing protein [Anaerolineae bacterium]